MTNDVYACKKSSLPEQSKKLDFYQVITGALLTCFIFGHLVLVSSILFGKDFFNGLAYFLEFTYIEFIILPLILFIMFAHFLIAARKMPFRQGEFIAFLKHAKSMKHCATWAWLIQIITAIIILALASTHIFQVMVDLPITAEKSAIRVQATGSCFYIALLLAVWLHVGIGIFRMGVKYGYIRTDNRKKVSKGLIILVLICILLGIITEIRYNTLALG